MKIEENKGLASFTTFKIGGAARYFVEVSNARELKEALMFAQEQNLRFFVLGGGSNIVMSDGGFEGLVIKNEIKGIDSEEHDMTVDLIVGAGENWDELVEYSVKEGLYGIENLSGIPGSVGASPIQNIGAYGSEVKDTILWVDTIDSKTLEEKRFTNAECEFGYRDSFFKTPEGKQYVITHVCFFLKKEGEINTAYKDVARYMEEKEIEVPTLEQMRGAVLEIRSRKFPDLKTTGTAGSFFKNPIVPNEKYEELLKNYPDMPGYPIGKSRTKLSCAWILDHILNLKGCYEGPVGFYERQPLVVVNKGGATAEEIKKLTDDAVLQTKEKLGIDLEREVTLVE